MRTITDDRLREIVAGLEGYGPDDKRVWYSPDLIREAFTELLSLRAPPSGEAGEVTEDMVRVACGRYMSTINSQPEDQRNGALAMRAALEAVRALPTIKEPTDGK